MHAAAALVFSPLLMGLSVALNRLVRGEAMSWVTLVRDTIVPEYAWGVTAYVVLLSVATRGGVPPAASRRERSARVSSSRLP